MLASLALRNLGRNRRRTLLTLCATVVSCSLLILALGIFSGMLADILDSTTGQYHGHLVVSSPQYPERRSLYDSFEEDLKTQEALLRHPGITGLSPRLRAFGLLSFTRAALPVELLGIRPQREASVTRLGQQLVRGSRLDSAGGAQPEVLIGEGLASRLGATVGDELAFMTQAADGSIGNDLLRIRGIFSTGDRNRDNQLALVPLDWLRELLVLPDALHELALRVDDPMEAPAIRQRLEGQLADADTSLAILDWGQLLPTMREAIANFDVSRMILIIILYSATGLGILNTFFMSVIERTREIGILLAMGMTPARVRRMILLEALFLGLISLVLGTLIGIALTAWMHQVGIDLSDWITPVTYAGGTIAPRLHATFETANILMPALILLGVCLLAGYFPARRASKLQPALAIREDA